MIAFCPRCHADPGSEPTFCPSCGARLTGAPRRLHRSSADAKIAGVCAGLAEYLEVDPTIVRVVYLAATVFTGFFPCAVLYLILILVVPRA